MREAPPFLFKHTAHADQKGGFVCFKNIVSQSAPVDPSIIESTGIVEGILNECLIIEFPFSEKVASGVEVAKVHQSFLIHLEVIELGYLDIGMLARIIHQVDIQVKGKKVSGFVLRP